MGYEQLITLFFFVNKLALGSEVAPFFVLHVALLLCS
jgi:hypothetical protein